MQRWAEMLEALGAVVRFDYSYVVAGRSRPDPLPQLIETHRAALSAAMQKHDGPAILIGKSMGGRVGCHVSLEETVTAVICLGYPLCGGGNRAKLRDQVLRAMRVPILFIQGTRDSLCPLDLLENVRNDMTVRNELNVVEGGDHSLLVTKTQLKSRGETQEEVDQRSIDVIEKFLSSV
jgi:predicted alpha/beta-hydrolase family hydrolase